MATSSPRLFAFLLAGAGLLLADAGFGKLRKKKLELDVRKPAVVRLAGTTLAFVGLPTNPLFAAAQQDLIATLSTELLANEKSLSRQDNPRLAEWALQVRINSFSMLPPQRINRGGINTRTVKAQDNVIQWNGAMDASYQVVDRGGKIHASRNVSYRYDKAVPETAPAIPWQPKTWRIPGIKQPPQQEAIPRTPEDLKQIIIHEVVAKIAEQLGNTSDKLEVQAATGEPSLDRSVDFMEQKLWSRARDQLESMSPLGKPDQEAYRQYNLGLVYEALAYEAKSASEQRANFFKAQEFYDKALEMNTRERYFVETIGRIRDGIAQYKALDNYQKEDVAKGRVADPAPPAGGRTTDGGGNSGGGSTLTVAKIIEMQQAGVADAMIVEIVEAASSLVYNPTDPQTAIQVSRAKLSIPVQNAMRKKVGARPIASGTPAATTTPTPAPVKAQPAPVKTAPAPVKPATTPPPAATKPPATTPTPAPVKPPIKL